MENASVYKADHIRLVWMDISDRLVGNVGTEIEAEIITDMRWYSLLIDRKSENIMNKTLEFA